MLKSEWDWEKSEKKIIIQTIADKIYELMSRNQAKLENTRKLWNQSLGKVWRLVPNFYL